MMNLSRHPRNAAFEWSPSQPPYRRVTVEQARQYDEQGFFVLENAFTHGEVDAVAAEIDPIEREIEQRLKDDFKGRLKIAKADAITFTLHLVRGSAVLRAFSRHEVFASLCRDLLSPNPRLYWDQAVYKKPGNPEEFPWHQDNGYTYVEPQQYLTCWVALNDATVENGCPWVVPGLHRLGTLAHTMTELGQQCLVEPRDALAAPVKKGGIVVFSSLTPHRTGPNLTRDARKAYILQYAPDGAVAYPHGSDVARPQDDSERQYEV
jgi:ectoine hydroxylase-related dioxygenase (phytanoyl-CoA dioxygenase family)